MSCSRTSTTVISISSVSFPAEQIRSRLQPITWTETGTDNKKAESGFPNSAFVLNRLVNCLATWRPNQQFPFDTRTVRLTPSRREIGVFACAIDCRLLPARLVVSFASGGQFL